MIGALLDRRLTATRWRRHEGLGGLPRVSGSTTGPLRPLLVSPSSVSKEMKRMRVETTNEQPRMWHGAGSSHPGAPSGPQSRTPISLLLLPLPRGLPTPCGSFRPRYPTHLGFWLQTYGHPSTMMLLLLLFPVHCNLAATKPSKTLPIYPFSSSPSGLAKVKPFLLCRSFPRPPSCSHFLLPPNHPGITSRFIL